MAEARHLRRPAAVAQLRVEVLLQGNRVVRPARYVHHFGPVRNCAYGWQILQRPRNQRRRQGRLRNQRWGRMLERPRE
jgi:hypothetical protein